MVVMNQEVRSSAENQGQKWWLLCRKAKQKLEMATKLYRKGGSVKICFKKMIGDIDGSIKEYPTG